MKTLALSAVLLAACAAPRTPSPAAAPAAAAPAAGAPALPPVSTDPALRDPAALNQRAPETFRVLFDTTKGAFSVQVTRAWAPIGADRFYNLVSHGYYDGAAFFRVLKGFMAQTGIHGDPQVSAAWRGANVPDDIREKSNTRGRVTFATGGPNTRTTQIFFNYADNSRLDGMGFTPFGEVAEGMDVLEALEGGYGEGYPQGNGPNQGRIQGEGNAYLRAEFPKLDYIKTARIQ
jgi:peptidyl-prolyl cis-trans isomerase A (cyclophilin A)